MNPHVDLEILAALAEGSLGPDDAAAVRIHLATCRSCTAAYADAVRYRAAWLAKPEAFAPPVAEVRALDHSVSRALGLAAPPPPRRAVPAWLSAAAALAVVSVGAAWFARGHRPEVTGLELAPAVRTATEVASSRGLVLPGGERLAGEPVPEMRSGSGEVTPELEQQANALLQSYEGGRRSAADAAGLVAALLAVSDLDGARTYAREGLRNHPRDVRLMVLYAAALQRDNDVAAAEAQLREAHRLAGRDPVVALDLALVLRQRGHDAEARKLLQQVARSRVAPLAGRAQRELNASR